MHAHRIVLFLSAYLGAVPLWAQPAKPSPQTPISSAVNEGLPTWLRFSGEERVRIENPWGMGFVDVSDFFLLNRLRLDMQVRPLPWLQFQFEGQDARVFEQTALPAPASQKNAIDLRVGYVQIGIEESSSLTLRAGRLPLAFGEGRVLADPGWSNVGRTIDAARLTVRRGPVKVDLFSGLLVKVDTMGCDQSTPGNHFHGAYGTVGQIVPNSTIEPYILWRLDHNFKNEAGTKGNLDEKTLGLRFGGKFRAADW